MRALFSPVPALPDVLPEVSMVRRRAHKVFPVFQQLFDFTQRRRSAFEGAHVALRDDARHVLLRAALSQTQKHCSCSS